MKLNKFWILLAVVAMFFVSCEKQIDTEFSIELRSSVVSYTKGSQFITVKADGKWSLKLEFEEGVEPWARLNCEEGNGTSYAVVLSYDANESKERRTATIIFTSGRRSYNCSMVQTANASAPMYMELPAFVPNDDYVFNTHRMQFQGASFRNYSYFYSMDDKVSLWVAYPLNRALIGSGSRTDAWAQDPLLPASCQAYIWNGGYGSGYDRGHQLPSADRLTPGANEQTFYATNMTPQVGAGFNQSIWADLETKVRGFSGSTLSDTLYVVTGCVVEGSTRTARWNTTVPTHHYKALLRYKPGAKNTVDNSGYNAIAMYMENKSYSSKTFTKEYVMSVRELEKLTGVDFFVNLKDYVGQETYDKIETQDPLTLKAVWGF